MKKAHEVAEYSSPIAETDRTNPMLRATSGGIDVNITSNMGEAIEKMTKLEQLLNTFNTGVPDELAQQLGTELGYIMQRNIDAGGRPPWIVSWREKLAGGTTLKDTGQFYNALPAEETKVVGNQIIKTVSSRLNKQGNPLARTMKDGGFIFPLNVHHKFSGQPYGLRFPKAEGGGSIYMKPGVPVLLPPRDFTTVPPEEAQKLVDIVIKYIEQQKQQIGFIVEGGT